MKLSWKKYKLELKHPFVLSYGAYNFRWSFLITIEDEGFVGLGEATAINYYHWTEDALQDEFQKLALSISSESDIQSFLNRSAILPPIRNAIHCAYIDLLTKKMNTSISTYYNIPTHTALPLSSITITGNSKQEFIDQINEYDWPIYKIKMGTNHDDIRLDVIRSNPLKQFRIDANAGWSIDWVKDHAQQLSMENIELIEQPFSTQGQSIITKLKEVISKPIYADESCQSINDIKLCARYFDGINIKIMKCGGIDKALAMIAEARKHELKIMIGCMTESSIGISHASQILPLVDTADIDGAVLIDNDIAIGTTLDRGQVIMSELSGCGAVLR